MTALLFTLIKQFKLPILTLILIALSILFYSAQIKKARNDGIELGRAQVQKKWNAERESMRLAVEQAEIEIKQLKEAQNEAVHQARDERSKASQRDANDLARLTHERDKLRKSLATALHAIRSCDLSESAQNARADTSATIEAVFDDMEREGAEMARAASGHAADSLMYQQAWPK